MSIMINAWPAIWLKTGKHMYNISIQTHESTRRICIVWIADAWRDNNESDVVYKLKTTLCKNHACYDQIVNVTLDYMYIDIYNGRRECYTEVSVKLYVCLRWIRGLGKTDWLALALGSSVGSVSKLLSSKASLISPLTEDSPLGRYLIDAD